MFVLLLLGLFFYKDTVLVSVNGPLPYHINQNDISFKINEERKKEEAMKCEKDIYIFNRAI